MITLSFWQWQFCIPICVLIVCLSICGIIKYGGEDVRDEYGLVIGAGLFSFLMFELITALCYVSQM